MGGKWAQVRDFVTFLAVAPFLASASPHAASAAPPAGGAVPGKDQPQPEPRKDLPPSWDDAVQHARKGAPPFENPEVRPSKGGVLDVELKVDVRDFANLDDRTLVRLRSYSQRLVGPTLRVRPGDQLRIRLKNHGKLKDDDPIHDEDEKGKGGEAAKDDHNRPNRFSLTNLHTHGLAVSPEPPADDVLRRMIEPGGSYAYCFPIPKDHPAGTFWYHPHRHGSTAFQLCSGLAGALIVDPNPGDKALETIKEVRAATEACREKIFLFQEIRHSAKEGDAAAGPSFPRREDVYGGDPREGRKEKETTWLVNGLYLPVLTMKRNEVQRWRCVNAGIGRTINLKVIDVKQANFFPLYRIAIDGLPLGRIEKQNEKAKGPFTLLPGGRSDFLFKAESPGTYYLVSGELEEHHNSRPEEIDDIIPLAVIDVSETAADPPMQIPDNDAFKGYGLPRLEGDGKVVRRVIEFRTKVGDDGGHYQFRWTLKDRPFADEEAGWKEFDQTRAEADLTVQAGATEEWTLRSGGGNHPFHIHVNPFLVVRERTGGREGSTRPVWRDTVLISDVKDAEVTIRMKFAEGLPGRTVLHCHNLDHEDKGMMMMVEIQDPARKGQPKSAGLPRVPAPAPAWTLPDGDGTSHRLADFGGRPVLLVFLRGVGCSHCLAQLRALGQRQGALRAAGLTVVAVCPDSSDQVKETLAELPADRRLPFLVLSEPRLDVFRRYGCCAADGPLHGTFLIDGSGSVRWQDVGEQPFMGIDGLLAEHGRLLNSPRRPNPASR